MNTLRALALPALAFFSLAVSPLSPAAAQEVTVVDMIPAWMSNEVNTDSEPNLAVDPATPAHMAASAFTFDLKKTGKAPIFLSTNGGLKWDLKPILPQSTAGSSLCASGFCDITLRFGGTSGQLYISSLTADASQSITYQVNRFDHIFSGPPAPVQLTKRSGTRSGVPDQPYVQATSVLGGEGAPGPRVRRPQRREPRRETADRHGRRLSNATAAPPGFASQLIEDGSPRRSRPGRLLGADCVSFQRPGLCRLLQSAFDKQRQYRRRARQPLGDERRAVRRSQDRSQPWHDRGARGPLQWLEKLLGQKVGRSQISIAVDPNDASSVWLVWGDADGQPAHHSAPAPFDRQRRDLERRPADDSGCDQPGTGGQQHRPGGLPLSASRRQRLVHPGRNLFRQLRHLAFPILLSSAPKIPGLSNSIGDYDHMMAVGKDFLGVFSAENTPDPGRSSRTSTVPRSSNASTTATV